MFKSRKQPSISEAAAPSLRPISVDLNFLPDRYRGRGLRILITLRPWLFLLGFALLLIPSAQLFWRDAAELTTVEVDLAEVSEALEEYKPLADERALLEVRITSAEAQIIELQAAYKAVNLQRVTWSDVVPLILAQVPPGVDLTLLYQSSEEVVFEGLAEAYPLPSILADNLKTLDEFESVTIQSVVLIDQEELREVAAEEAPAEDSGTDETLAEQPIGEGGEEAASDQPEEDESFAVAVQVRRLPYRFVISIFLPSIVEPTPEPLDEN